MVYITSLKQAVHKVTELKISALLWHNCWVIRSILQETWWLQVAFEVWRAQREHERRQDYSPVGLQSYLSAVQAHSATAAETRICQVVRYCYYYCVGVVWTYGVKRIVMQTE